MYLRRDPRSTRWRAEYRDAAGDRHSRTFDTRAEAKAWATEQERDVRRGRHVDPRAGRQLLGAYAETWWAGRVVEATTAATDRGRLDLHVLPAWRSTALEAVTPSSVQAWVRRLTAVPLAAATVRSCVQLLASILEAARVDGLIPDNPARGVQLPTVPPGRELYLSRAEAALLLERIVDDTARLVVRVLLFTGMRWGEVAGLHAGRLDLLRARVDVVETLVEAPGVRTVKAYPKGRRRRSVPLTGQLVDELAAYLAEHPRGRDELLWAVSRHTFARTHVKPALRCPDHEELNPSCAACLPDVHVHDLRHTCASWLVQAGVTLPEVGAVLGHASITTTMRYAHLAPDTHDRVLDALEPAPPVGERRLRSV